MRSSKIFFGVLWLGVILLLAACSSGGDGNGSTTQTPAAGNPTVLNSTLSGDQEVPPVTTAASGTGTVTVSADGSQIDFTVSVTGPFSSAITQAHIHTGAVGANGPIILYLCANPNFAPTDVPVPPLCSDTLDGPSGQISGTLTAADLRPVAVQGIADFADAVAAVKAGDTYFNIHTQNNAGGELRGQIGVTVPPPAVTALADAYTWIGNTPLTVPAAMGVLANDPAGSAIVSSATTTAQGGTVNVAANGGFTYTPPAQTGAGAFTGSDTFTYSVGDAAGDVTVTIDIANAAWYVDSSVAVSGDGSFGNAFLTLPEAFAAAGAGDTIFVFAGTGAEVSTDAAVTLLPGQKLLGEGAAFSFAAKPGNLIEIVPANAAMPGMSDSLAPVVTLANDCEVAGFELISTNEPAVQVTAVSGYNVHDNLITNPATAGIDLLNVTGTGTVANNTIPNSAIDGIDITIDSAVAVTAQITVSGNVIDASQGAGISLLGLTAGAAHDISTVLTGNQVTNSVGGGILVRIQDDANLKALVDGNTLLNNLSLGAPLDFDARAQNNATVCLELTNNGNAGGTATFDVRADNLATLQIFESNNDNPATRAGAGTVATVTAGFCGVP